MRRICLLIVALLVYVFVAAYAPFARCPELSDELAARVDARAEEMGRDIDTADRGMSASMKINETNELSDDIDTAMQDLGRICLADLSEEEVLQAISLYGKINHNLKEYLKKNG